MTSKAIFYYSVTGNTKAIVEESDTSGFDVYNISKIKYEEINFEPYDLILIGTSTWGDGVPPNFFKTISPLLRRLQGKRIGLFGSGNSIYQHFCGALDLLEGLLIKNNQITFKYKFESYPTQIAKKEFQLILDSLKEKKMELIKFYKDGCSPCQSLSTYLDNFGVIYKNVNAFKEPPLAIQYKVMSLPTLILVDENGEEIQRSIGFKPNEVQEMITKLTQ